MVIGDACLNAQPKKGIDSNSFLATNASGGHTKFSASLSQVDECFDMTICGVLNGGRLSRPITCCLMPQIHRPPNSISQHHPMMNLKRGIGGSQESSRTRIAYIGVTTSWYSANRRERSADMVSEGSQSPASSAVATNARSGKMTVFFGKSPSRNVFSPLP